MKLPIIMKKDIFYTLAQLEDLKSIEECVKTKFACFCKTDRETALHNIKERRIQLSKKLTN